jgi:hypothetical protein
MVTFRNNPVEPPRGFHLAATNRGTMVAPTSGNFGTGVRSGPCSTWGRRAALILSLPNLQQY